MSVIIARMSTWSGKSLGNVEIGSLIARGGMAEVYHGRHVTLKRDVAVKIMRDHVEEDPDSRRRFEREAQVIASLDHPNIIRIFDHTLVDGRPCIVMELVTGASLGGYLKGLQKRGETLPHETIAHLLTSIASAIDHAHKQNIVHRDIKPANILLRAKNGESSLEESLPGNVEPVLTDFGLVRLLDSSTQTSTGTVSGTPSYMSPEQARGDRVNHKTDIYSLGVVLYEMLAGNVPFDAESSFGVLMKHLNEPPPPILGITRDLQAVINRALAKNPAHRFESAGELADEFKAALAGQKVSQRTEKISEMVTAPSPPKPGSSRIPLFAGGVFAMALVALLAAQFFRPTTPPPLSRDKIVGRVTFLDFNDVMDKVSVTINGLPLPVEGTHYEAWFLAQGGEMRHNLGAIAFVGESGSLTFVNPAGVNLLGLYDQLEVTLEPNDDSNPGESSDNVVASSIFPPLALNHIRHILVAIGSTPDGAALIQGLWKAADSIETSMQDLHDAFDDNDEKVLRLKTEEVILQLAGNRNKELYMDWNGDGGVSDPLEGFGFLPNGDPGSEQGYLPQTLAHAGFAMEAPDATLNIMENEERLAVCIENMEGWGNQLLELAMQLQEMTFDFGMEATIAEMQALSGRILYGEDSNGNGRIEPILNECGADTAYETAYLLAEMPLFPGAERIPPPANSPNP